MKNLLPSFPHALKLLLKDKVTLGLSFIPVVLGSILFYFSGSFIYKKGNDILEGYFKGYSETSTAIASVVIKALVFVVIYFLINWLFVLIVSAIAGPFNDLISGRIEKLTGGREPESFSNGFKEMIRTLGSTIFNEAKKLGFIIVLSVIAFLLGLSTVLAPVGLFISALLVAISFVDYSWSRHDLPFSSCLADLMKNIFSYTIAGFIFMGFIAVPILNLLALPYGVVYFTVFWSRSNPKLIEEI